MASRKRNRKTRTLAKLAVVAGLLGVVGGGLYYVQKNKGINDALRQGIDALNAQDYPRAMSKLNYYVSRNNKNPDALFALSQARKHVRTEGTNYLDSAARFARAAHDLAPERVDIMEELVGLYGDLGRASEAVAIADRLLEIEPRNKPALAIKTEALNATGKIREALENERKASEYFPDDFEIHQRVIMLMDIAGEDRQKTLAYIERLEGRFSGLASFWSTQSQFLTMIGDNDRAVLMARKAASIPPKDPAELSLLLDQLSIERTVDPSLTEITTDVLQRVITTSLDKPDMLFAGIVRAFKEGETNLFEQGVELARTRIHEVSADDLVYWIVGIDPKNDPTGIRDAAMKQLQTRSDPSVPHWLTFIQAWDAFARGEVGPARQLLDKLKAVDIDPQLPTLLDGRISQALNEAAIARSRFEILAASRAWHIARRDLAAVRLQMGDAAGVIQLARVDPKLTATTGGIIILMAAHVDRAERLDATRSMKEAALSMFTTIMPQITRAPPELFALQARAAIAAGQIDEARALVNSYILQTDRIPNAFSLVTLADRFRAHDTGITASLLDLARKEYPNSPSVEFARAIDIANRGDVEAGRTVLKELAAQATPDQRNEVTSLSAIFESRFNNPVEGQRALAEAARSLPDDIGAQLALLNDPRTWNTQDNIEEAIERLRKLTGENATGWRIFKARQLLLFGNKEADVALASKFTSEVLRDDPTNIDARVLAGDAWMVMGDRTRAIEQYRAAAELGDQGVATYPALIELLLFDGQRSEAERYLRLFMDLPNLPADLVTKRGLLSARAGWESDARDDLMRGVEAKDEAAGLELIRILMRQDDRSEAQRVVNIYLKDNNSPLPSMVAIAADLVAMDNGVDAGLPLLDQLPNDPPIYMRTIAQAELLNRFGQVEKAKQTVRPLHQQGVVSASTVLARLELDSGNPQNAITIINESLAKHPDNLELKKIRSRMNLASGDNDMFADALYDLARAAANSNAEIPGTQELIGTLDRLVKKQIALDAAMLEVQRITSNSPTNFDAWRVLATMQLNLGKPDDAAKSAHAASAASPNDPRAQEFAARTLQLTGNPSDARTIALGWARILGAQSFEADCFLASIESTLGNAAQAYDRIKPWIDRINTLGDADPDKAFLLGVILAQNNEIDRAASILWPIDATNPTAVLRYLSAVNVFTDKTEVARKWIQRAEPTLTNIPNGRLALADKWYKVSVEAEDGAADLRNVVAMLDGHIEQMSQPDMAYLMLAAAHQALNELDKAETAFRKSLAIQPNNTKAMNNLAYLLINKPGGIEEAAKVAANAVEVAQSLRLPSQELSAYHDTLGLALLRSNQPRNALAQFDRSMSLNQASGSAAIGLAETYLALDKPTEARSAISRFDRIPDLARGLASEERERLTKVQSELRSKGF